MYAFERKIYPYLCFKKKMSSPNNQATHYPYLLGSIGVPQPAQKKFWAATMRSLLRAENDKSYISEKAKGAFFTDWKRN